MFAYCLQCQTQRCGIIAELLEYKGIHRAFSPKIISRQRKEGQLIEHTDELLPGYVFFFTEKPLTNNEPLSGINGIVRCLGGNGLSPLANSDLDFALNLYKKDGVLGKVTALKEGQMVRMIDPLFEDYPGRIVQLDCRKQRAKVEFRFDEQDRTVWVACDVLFAERTD